jgi:alkylated DNA repair dioxygenase AlkB
MQRIDLQDGWIGYIENFIPLEDQLQLYETLRDELQWESGEIKVFGKVYTLPRLEAFYAELGKSYGYSGKQMNVREFDSTLLALKNKIEEKSAERFNSVLANWYRDGQDSNGWHADNEKELGKNPVIASLSLGETRRFDLRHTKTKEKVQLELKSGSLLIMGGELQHFWKHQIAKTKKVKAGRINLTFRMII